ncbi:MAG: cystathionine gamma-synthase [Armatimonadetes bacterium 55-13]|nr:PLP-dependent transferase [Armatimonadota bacterium]OJU64862.1 MAG: cystathionine gamma-synthase [Armatimonadetes bacterium 55-13]
MSADAQSFETKVIHAGIEPDPLSGAVMTPIYQTSTYAQSSPGEHKGYEYSRTDNPTRTVLQTQLAELEQGTHALVFSSGLAATDAVLNLFQSGDHIIAGDDLYGGTYRLFEKVATYRGLEFDFIDLNNEGLLREKIKSNTKLIWFETPTNPMLNIFDIAKIASIAKEHGLLSVVDNTFMSPFFQNPLTLGADIVMHSMTKYINGHSDVVMGCLILKDREIKAPRTTWRDPNFAAPRTLYSRLKFLQNAVGATPGPFDCWLVLRGIKTLAVRMERHAQNALRVAHFLQDHPTVERVIYPGLPSHPGHDLASRQMRGFGGMMTFFTKGGLDQARTFLENLKLFTLAESLGGVESLIEHPAIMTHASIPAELRREIGIHDNLIRVSAGIENADDLIADLDQALAKI